MSEEKVSELSSLLIPLYTKSLILPNVAIAEVIHYMKPEEAENQPSWFLGMIPWRNIRIPVISYETLDEIPFSMVQDPARIVVLNSGQLHNLSFYGVICRGIPRLVRLTKEEIHPLADQSLGVADQMLVKYLEEPYVIPNMSYLENLMKDIRLD